jgi:chromosomal replication initiation ATPase DnaA
MKKDIFDRYAHAVADEFGIPTDALFMKTKERHITHARHMLFYLCHKRMMNIASIMLYMRNNEYETGHSSIIYGIHKTESRMDEDSDYVSVAKKIQEKIK